jgi:competence protein ComEC
VGPPPGKLFSETNGNSVALLPTHGTARVLLAGDAEAKTEECMASESHAEPLTVINV